jgi:hypothetical protein
MIIGISGKMRVGKTTITQHLDPMLVPWHAPHNFGDEVKEECAKLLKQPRSLFHKQDKKDEIITIPSWSARHFGLAEGQEARIARREAMQFRGATARKENPGYWVYRLHERIHNLAHVIIDDVRYPNECEYIQTRGGLLVRVHPHPYWRPEPHAEHESETALDDWTNWDMEFWPDFGVLESIARKIADNIPEIQKKRG